MNLRSDMDGFIHTKQLLNLLCTVYLKKRLTCWICVNLFTCTSLDFVKPKSLRTGGLRLLTFKRLGRRADVINIFFQAKI